MERPGAPERKALEKAAAAANGAGLPEGGEYYYLKNFQGFKQRVDSFKDRLQHLLTSLPAAAAAPPPTDAFGDVDEAGDWVTSLLDVTLEAVDDALADAKRAGEAAAASAAPQPWLPPGAGAGAGPASAATTKASPAGPAAGRGRGGGDGFVSYMESQLQRRPQESFDDPVDNSRAPFVHRLDSLAEVVDVEVAAAAAAAAAAAGEAPPHPLADRLAALQYPGWQLEAGEARPPKDLEETPFTYIDTLPALRAAAERLAAAKEVAIDLEAHNYRSFQGFCCLMQLSTRSEDIVVDTLALRPHIGPALAAVFADPSVVKVLHGADSDVVWLQRDFGLYLCNMFDTGQAARVLEFKGLGLAYLLDFYCSFKADKRFQLADWRVRPLTSEMLHYARCDTHYLLYCYDRLRAALVEAGDVVPEGLDVELPAGAQAAAAGGRGALAIVLERSRRLCLQQYEKEAFTPLSFMELLSKLNATLTDAQLSVFAALYEWRDRVCRELDESTGYVLPRAQLLKLAQALPRTVADIHKAVGRSSPVVSRRSGEVLAAIQAAQQPEAVAAARELRQRPWKQALEEQQQQARGAQQQAEPAAAGDAAAPGQQQQAQPVQQEVAAVEDAKPKPTLKPRAIKPLAAPTAGGSLLAALASAPTAAKPLLQPRRVRPLTTGSSMLGAAPVSSCTAAVPQQPGTGVAAGGAVPTATAAAAEAEQMATEPAAAPEAAQGGAPVAAAEAAPADSALPGRRLTPAGLQQKTAMLGGLLGNGAASGQQRHGPPLLGRGVASSVGSLLGTAAGGHSSAMAAAAAAVKASFALPFALAATAPAADAAVRRGPAGALAPADQAQQQQAAASVQADAAPAGQSTDAQRDAIRAAVDAMQREDNQGGGSNQGEHGQQQQQQQQQQQGRGGQGAAGSSPLEEFMPLPVSAQFGKGAVKRRQPQEQQPAGVTKQVRRQRDTVQHLKRTMVELGLEDASSSGESDSEPEGAPAGKRRRPQQREQQPAKRAGAARQAQQAGSSGGAAPVGETEAASAGAGKRVDYAAAKDKFNLGIVNPHALPQGEAQNPRRQGGRGRGRGGRSGGRGGRGGRGRDEDAPRMPPGKFNPYAAPEVNALKAGKRSAVHVRSGNRSMTFRD